MFEKILIVCAGNICRSPMAQGLLSRELRVSGWSEMTVESAGLYALSGHPADDRACQLMLRQGIDISAHRAQRVTAELIRAMDLILVMEMQQKKLVETVHPSARGRTYRVGEWQDRDVPDPYCQSDEIYEQVLGLLSESTADWVPKLTA